MAALDYVKPGMKLGLGTGSTANHFIDCVGEKVKAGLDVACVPTSEATREQAEEPRHSADRRLNSIRILDLTVDGADEFDGEFQLIKGGGGALLIEKIVATSSRHMIVIADRVEAGRDARQVSRCRSKWCPSASRPPPGRSSAPCGSASSRASWRCA